MVKAGLYARVSTDEQTTDSQLVALQEYCRCRGFEIFDIYIDKGISGSTKSRPELDRLNADARRRRFGAVVVFRFDRFARSTKHLLSALDEFKALGIDFISLNEAIDTSTPMGEAIFTILSAIGQLERDIIRERVKSGLRAAVSKGKRLGRPPKIDPLLIAKFRLEGLSLREIGIRVGATKSAVYKSLLKSGLGESQITQVFPGAGSAEK